MLVTLTIQVWKTFVHIVQTASPFPVVTSGSGDRVETSPRGDFPRDSSMWNNLYTNSIKIILDIHN